LSTRHVHQRFNPHKNVGVDVRTNDGRGNAGEDGEFFHHGTENLRTSVMQPASAAAAAIAGLARWVRAPGPWRPSKLRFEVETARCPGGTVSPFAARHIEQPGSRHSNPAWRKISWRPSASAARLTFCEPGTTHACTLCATLRPLATAAAARRS